jgi:hypothetical protein
MHAAVEVPTGVKAETTTADPPWDARAISRLISRD